MGKVKMTIHKDGVDDLLGSQAVKRLVELGARDVASNARQLAPNGGPGKGVRETYKSTKAKENAVGVSATAYTTDPFGHLVEWGSIHNPAYAPLRRGAERSGLRTTLAPKGS